MIWIPDNNGVLNAYNSDDFFYLHQVQAKYKFADVSDELIDYQNNEKRLIAYLFVDKNYIYIGNFFKTKESIIKKYKIINDNNVFLEYMNSFGSIINRVGRFTPI